MADEASRKIKCLIDDAECHAIAVHLRQNHPDWTIERYKETYPGAPIISDYAQKLVDARVASKKTEASAATINVALGKQALASIFGLGKVAATKNARGEDIMVSVFSEESLTERLAPFVPDVDMDYVFDIEVLKTFLMGFELSLPMLCWGMHGTGKTTIFEQFCARTKRAFMRVQHTANTEESHLVGQYVVRDGATEWQNRPLVEAMLTGMTYCADEYDFANPNVTAVYQPVLEGKPLIIKEAPPEFRVVRPHPNFRFVATGNTNGAGDETGLYQGTMIQNAANYSRFGITVEMSYMAAKIEKMILMGKAGVDSDIATKFVEFAKSVRDAFAGGKIGMTISPREMITCAKLGRVRGSDWRSGLMIGFMARLTRVDREVIDQFAQRTFG